MTRPQGVDSGDGAVLWGRPLPFRPRLLRCRIRFAEHLEESLRADAGRQPGKGRRSPQRRRWLPLPPRCVGKPHPDYQRIRHLSFGPDGGGFPFNDRTGLKASALVGVAAGVSPAI